MNQESDSSTSTDAAPQAEPQSQSEPEQTVQQKLAESGIRHRPIDSQHGEIARKLQESGIRHRTISDDPELFGVDVRANNLSE